MDNSLPRKDVERWLYESQYRAEFLSHICAMTRFKFPPRWADASDPVDTHRQVLHYFGVDLSPQICAAQYLTTALSRTWPDATVIRQFITDHSDLIQFPINDFNPVLGQVIFGSSTSANTPNFFRGLKSRLQPIDWLPDRPSPPSSPDNPPPPPPPPPPPTDGGRFSFLIPPKPPTPTPVTPQEPNTDVSP